MASVGSWMYCTLRSPDRVERTSWKLLYVGSLGWNRVWLILLGMRPKTYLTRTDDLRSGRGGHRLEMCLSNGIRRRWAPPVEKFVKHGHWCNAHQTLIRDECTFAFPCSITEYLVLLIQYKQRSTWEMSTVSSVEKCNASRAGLISSANPDKSERTFTLSSLYLDTRHKQPFVFIHGICSDPVYLPVEMASSNRSWIRSKWVSHLGRSPA